MVGLATRPPPHPHRRKRLPGVISRPHAELLKGGDNRQNPTDRPFDLLFRICQEAL